MHYTPESVSAFALIFLASAGIAFAFFRWGKWLHATTQQRTERPMDDDKLAVLLGLGSFVLLIVVCLPVNWLCDFAAVGAKQQSYYGGAELFGYLFGIIVEGLYNLSAKRSKA